MKTFNSKHFFKKISVLKIKKSNKKGEKSEKNRKRKTKKNREKKKNRADGLMGREQLARARQLAIPDAIPVQGVRNIYV